MNTHSPHIILLHFTALFIGKFCCCNSCYVLITIYTIYCSMKPLSSLHGHYLIDRMMLHNFNNKRFAVHSIWHSVTTI